MEEVLKQAKSLADKFQSGFGSVHYYSHETLSPIGGWEPSPGSETAEHRTVKGEGDTAEAALVEWEKELAKLPQNGRAIYWRVLPEINHERDFCTQKTRWQVFARLAIFP